MRTVLRACALLLLLTVVTLVAVLAAALQSAPAVALSTEPDFNDVQRALNLVRMHDPRKAQPGEARMIQIGERDIELLLNHAARGRLDLSARIGLERGTAKVLASLHLPANPFGRWLNLQAEVAETGALPVIESLHVGRVPVPVWLGERLGLHLVKRAGLQQELAAGLDMVQRVNISPQQLRVIYVWRDDSTERVLGALVPASEHERLRAYSERLAAVTQASAPAWTLSLAPLMGPLFELAQQRSRAGNDAVAENRALLFVLTLYANGRNLSKLVPTARQWPQPRPMRLSLRGREDWPLHFLVSAALAAEGTGPLSKAIGIYKEVADSRGGTGFSFNDMAANRAGTRLGELAVSDPGKLQAALAGGVQEADFMPPAADLPEFMTEADFKRRFGGVGEPPYLEMMAEIERRVDALPVLRR